MNPPPPHPNSALARITCAAGLLATSTALLAVEQPATHPPADAHVLFIAGEKSHGPGEHEHPAGCALLAKALNESGLAVNATISLGWPTDAALTKANTIVIYSDGLGGHVANGHVDALRRHVAAGRGLAIFHFAVEPSPGELADFLLESLGGRFETELSVNPVWKMDAPLFGAHPIANGVGPFAIDEELYFHLRFREGIVPILSAVPPASSVGKDGPRSGNPAVRAEVEDKKPQILAWALESKATGARAYGYTGGHFHRNWTNDGVRKLTLNAIIWTAHLEVQEGGVASSVLPIPRYTTIEEAIARGDLDDVKRHVAAYPERLNEGKNPALPPLHQAILRNKETIALFLLDSGANPDAPDPTKRTPLHLTVDRDSAPIAKALLAKHANPNQLDGEGWTPLHHAAARDRLEVAGALLEGGANPITLSARGGTPLHEAAASGSAEMVRLLLDHGVDPAIVSKTGVTALDLAREYKNEAALEILENLTASGKGR